MLNRSVGGATLIDLADGPTHEVPIAGFATIAITAGSPDTFSNLNLPLWLVAGEDGVQELGDDGGTFVTEPTERVASYEVGGHVLQLRDGRIVEFDRATGQLRDLYAPSDQAGTPTLQDVTLVDGVPTVLITMRNCVDPGHCTDVAYVAPLADPAALTKVMDVGGWEAAPQRLHLGANGMVVGDLRSGPGLSPLLVNVDGSPHPFAERFDASYPNCMVDRLCPHGFAVSKDGTRVAWIEGRTVIVVDLATDARTEVALAEEVREPVAVVAIVKRYMAVQGADHWQLMRWHAPADEPFVQLGTIASLVVAY